MSIKSRLLNAAKNAALWGEKEWCIGPVSVLLCDLGLSVNLLRNPTATERASAEEGEVLGKRATYGIALEPFMVSLIGSDGDIWWQSPGLDLTTWLVLAAADAESDETWVNVGDLVVKECQIQSRYGVDYIFGDRGYPCLGKGLRFREPTRAFCGEKEFIPEQWEGLQEVSQLGDYCHGVEIHKDDAAEFVRRIKKVRSRNLCSG